MLNYWVVRSLTVSGLIVFCLFGMFSGAALSGQDKNGLDRTVEDISAMIEKADRYFANIHQDKSGLETSVQLYQQVLEQQPDHLEALWKLSEVLFISAMEAGDENAAKAFYEQSLAHAEKALVSDPLCVAALFYSGCAHVSLADMAGVISALSLLKKGKKELARAMEFAPADRFGIVAAVVLSQVNSDAPWPMRDLGEAEKLAKQAVAWDADLTMAGTQLAAVYFQQKKYDAARNEARRCLDIARPTYMSDAVLWDWPASRQILAKIKGALKEKTGE